jgi:hypothetical protein
MKTERSRQLSELLLMTNTSLENARDGNWELLIRDEQQRGVLIKELFSTPLDVDEAQKYRHTIEEILRLNTELEQLTSNARNRLLWEAGSISKGRQALNKYSENAG